MYTCSGPNLKDQVFDRTDEEGKEKKGNGRGDRAQLEDDGLCQGVFKLPNKPSGKAQAWDRRRGQRGIRDLPKKK